RGSRRGRYGPDAPKPSIGAPELLQDALERHRPGNATSGSAAGAPKRSFGRPYTGRRRGSPVRPVPIYKAGQLGRIQGSHAMAIGELHAFRAIARSRSASAAVYPSAQRPCAGHPQQTTFLVLRSAHVTDPPIANCVASEMAPTRVGVR